MLWFLGDVTTAEVSVGCAEVEQAKTVTQVAKGKLGHGYQNGYVKKTRLVNFNHLIIIIITQYGPVLISFAKWLAN